MLLVHSNYSESVEFSESESSVDEISISQDSLEKAGSYPIAKAQNNPKIMKKDCEMFIPFTPVVIKIVSVKYCPIRYIFRRKGAISLASTIDSQNESLKEKTIHKFNPYIYEIQLEHGPFCWTIFRRYNEFLSVHEQVILRVATLKLPIPTKNAVAKRDSFKEESRLQSIKVGRKKRTLPPFPKKLEILVTETEIEVRKEQLQAYLQAVLNYKVFRDTPEIMKFFEVSAISFINCLGIKRKEGIVRKRCGGRVVSTGCLDCFKRLIYPWSQRWLFVKDTFVAYIDLSDSRIGDVLLMDSTFQVTFGLDKTGKKAGLIISNKNRRLFCTCQTIFRMKEWVQSIEAVMNSTGKEFIQPNKHESFAPSRSDTFCKWYIDGERYMKAVSNALEQAKEEIYIANWWLSPQLHLKRPAMDNYWRLDNILLRKAEAGVLVFVLIFKEIAFALKINSQYTKDVLSKLHPNIQVLRHPNHLRRRVLLWSHHEKMLVIDQKICFLGGIDLCYGRWDNSKHPVQDVTRSQVQDHSLYLANVPDLSYGISRMWSETIHVPDVKQSFSLKQSLFSSRKTISPLLKMQFESFLSRPNVSYRDIPKKISDDVDKHKLIIHDSAAWKKGSTCLVLRDSGNKPMSHPASPAPSKNTNAFDGVIVDREGYTNVRNNSILTTSEDLEQRTLFGGKDYVNWIVKDCIDLDKPDIDLIDRGTVPRMPWHDIGCLVNGRAARDVARHFIHRWNAVKKEKANKKVNYSMLVPKSYIHSEIHKMSVINYQQSSCQVLRSVCEWSANINSTEKSILNAYIETIRKAKHFIYIENQFFISATSDQSEVIRNKIGKEILQRIIHFHKRSKTFKVYILLPLLPAFETDIKVNKGTALYTVLHYNYISLFRGNESLFACMRRLDIDPLQYVQVCSLRNYGYIGDKLSTEQIYVHSKLMIVDDLYTLIGSSNINDRSMLGSRDSELAILFKDEPQKQVTFDKHVVKVGQFSSSLRKTLMAEHLGLVLEDCEKKGLLDDPVSDSFFMNTWRKAAVRNTAIFEEVFACVPSDKIKSFTDFSGLKKKALLRQNPNLAKEKIQAVRGHLVIYPTEFLLNENLMPSLVTKEGMIPLNTWI